MIHVYCITVVIDVIMVSLKVKFKTNRFQILNIIYSENYQFSVCVFVYVSN